MQYNSSCAGQWIPCSKYQLSTAAVATSPCIKTYMHSCLETDVCDLCRWLCKAVDMGSPQLQQLPTCTQKHMLATWQTHGPVLPWQCKAHEECVMVELLLHCQGQGIAPHGVLQQHLQIKMGCSRPGQMLMEAYESTWT